MTFCKVDMDIRNHAHEEGILAEKEIAWESRSSELLDDFLDGQNNDLYEELGIWFEEDNEPDNEWLRNMMIAYEKNDNGYLLELARDMMKQVRERAGKIAEEQATNEMEG